LKGEKGEKVQDLGGVDYLKRRIKSAICSQDGIEADIAGWIIQE
jgi:hypothetical protein